MKTIFFHDHITTRDDNILYSTGGLNNKVISRYLKFSKEFSLATRSDPNREINKLTNVGSTDTVKFIPIPNLTTIVPSNYIIAYKKISDLIDQNEVIIIRLPSIIGLIAVYIAEKKKKNNIIELVGCPWDSYSNYSIKGILIAGPISIFTKYFVKNAINVLYVTGKFLQNRYPTKADNQIGCSDVEIVVDKKVLDKRFKKENTNNYIKIGMIGSLDAKYKGYDTAIKALGILIKNNKKQYKLEIVGGGNPEKVQKLFKKNNLEAQVTLKGTLSHPTGIFNWLDSIDLYLQPSRVEGLPRSLVEAMSRGCACIGSNVGDIPDLIDSNYIHKKNDYKKLASIIRDLSEKDIMKEQAKMCFKKACEYDKSILDAKREKFYRSCLPMT